MTRIVERSEGLALAGSGSVGPLRLRLPALLESRREGEDGPGLRAQAAMGGSGRRRLALSTDGATLELEFPILAPEVSGTGTGVHAAAPGAVVVHAPVSDAGWSDLRATPPELVVLGNARTLWSEGRSFVLAVREIRDRLGARPVLWAPRVALPHRLPFLVYLGVDVVDTTEGRWHTAAGERFDPTLGPLGPGRAEEADLAAQDRTVVEGYRRAMDEVQRALAESRLRELVESRTAAEPSLGEMLRYADRELGLLLEERAPVTGAGTRAYVLAESHRRPEMARFRRRLLERYRPPPSKGVLLLVPCSKTKPYRLSRSHRRFTGALEGLPGLERVHVVSVSSPIGVVPRELEDLPPARQYDIPVTGEWTEAERAFVTAGVDHLIATGRYRRMVVHLDPSEYAFLLDRPGAPATLWTVPDDATTSPAALARLREAVASGLAELARTPGGPLAVVREELRELAAVQFGRPAAETLFAEPVRLAGRPWFQRVTDGRTDLATVREERGLFHLTVAGARKLDAVAPLCVDVDPALSLQGDLFAPGVRDADPAIRVGDSVVLRRDGHLAGVGEAALPGRLMTQLGHGVAVRVRHRSHESTDSPMTAEA